VIDQDGDALITALAAVSALAHRGWASQAAAAEDLTQLCPGAWVQPGAAEPRSSAGRGQHTSVMRSWIVVITVAGLDTTPLESSAGPIVDAVRVALTGLDVGNEKPPRRLHYVAENEPFYAPGYIELPLEFELTETFSGETP